MTTAPQVLAGRYTLIRKLATGGMAEVFLARQHGLQGFEKLVVLKRILPGYADNEEFVRMFIDEARTAADLRHPNIVNLFDAGQDQGQYFITMEYLRGQDLGSLIKRALAKNVPIPLEYAVQMIIDAARGLYSAHVKTDLKGQPLGIVHRDISPQNLFVTYDGITKVLDFGIARARHRSTKTELGTVKGKLGYVSPEQLDGLELDARNDLFALGVVLYEVTTLKRLFGRPSDAEVLRAILECKVPPPSSIVPGYPPRLEAIVLKALAGDRERRYADCNELARALEDFLAEMKVPFSPSRLGEWLGKLFPEASAPERFDDLPPVDHGDAATDGADTKDLRPDGRRKNPTRPDRKRPALQDEDDFLSAVGSFLGQRADGRKSNLVPPVGPFVGREKDLEAVARLFGTGARLVTVSGFGGMGKTRLASQFAWAQLELWKKGGGAWFIDLSQARTVNDVCQAVSRALDVQVPATAEDSATLAGRSLRSLGRALVVLDNFEQIVPVGQETVGTWLTQAPECRFLVTTREALRLPGEQVLELAPLAVPAAGDTSGSGDAVKLFLARAEHAGARALSPGELRDVAAICRRLDGHPLAIELAAARMDTQRPAQILERLSERFELLGGRDARGRHATLWNAIDWSWQILTPAEQAAFAQLSVFRGGFTIESACAVIDLSAVPDAPGDFEVVEALHRKSLLRHFVVPEVPDELRLGMYESIHEFASEKLDPALLLPARARHAAHFLLLGDVWAGGLTGTGSVECLGHLEAERENLIEVFERSLSTLPPTPQSAANALKALHALEPVLLRKGSFASHLALLSDGIAVARGAGTDATTLVRAMQQRGNLQRVLGRPAQAVEELFATLTLARTTGDRRLEGSVMCDLAVARFVSGDLSAAREGLDGALQLARSAGDAALELHTLGYLAIVHVATSELSRALQCCDEALPIARARGDRLSEARLLGTMGAMYLEHLKIDLAWAFFSDAIARCRDVKELRLQGYYLGKRAWALVERGALVDAEKALDDAISRLSDVGDLRHEGLFLAYLGTVQALEGRTEQARVSLGSAQARLANVKDPLFLTALALHTMHVEVLGRNASRAEARALLDDVNAATSTRTARVSQSEEVRLAARLLERAVQALPAAPPHAG